MFFVGALPALLALWIRLRVEESEVWEATKERERQTKVGFREVLLQPRILRRFVYLVLLMAAFNFMSHGTQDYFPTFLEDDFGAGHTTITLVAIIYNVGALIGGMYFGALSQRFGRRRTIILCAALALPVAPLFAYAPTLGLVTVGAFLMQLFVQGAWGVIPAHLTELSPDEIRGFYPGVTYQLGNLLAALNLPLQTSLADSHSPSFALLVVIVPVLVAVIALTALGSEAHSARFGEAGDEEARALRHRSLHARADPGRRSGCGPRLALANREQEKADAHHERPACPHPGRAGDPPRRRGRPGDDLGPGLDDPHRFHRRHDRRPPPRCTSTRRR